MATTTAFSRLREDFTTVAAIDFGTTFSGYAFSFKEHPDTVHQETSWGSDFNFPYSPKTPTFILTNNENKFEVMGYDAKQKMDNMLPEEHKSYRYYDRFKMQLHNPKEKLTVETIVEDQRGNECCALDIFVMVLKHMKKKIKESMEGRSQRVVEDRHMRWVITVPAIWSDAAKQFMKQATIKSGLALDKDASNVVIALEPEAASLYCKDLPNADFGADRGDVGLNTGDKYLVLDFGGGTLDITCHEILKDGKIAELHHANGGAMGSTRVDAEFVKLLDKIFKFPFTEVLKKESPTTYNSLIDMFELKKRRFREGNQPMVLDVLKDVCDVYEKHTGRKMENDVSKEYAEKGVRFTGKIAIPNHLIVGCFTQLTKEVVAYVGKLLKVAAMKDVTKILMVGGFSACPFLQGVIRDTFGKKYKVLVPNDAWSAVVKGALKFGHNPDSVSVRKAKLTYGTSTYKPYDPAKHSADRVRERNGKKEVLIFHSFVKKGKDIKIDHSVTKTYHPTKVNQDRINFDILTSEEMNPVYPDEAGVKKIGKVRVAMAGSGRDRDAEVTMSFGGTDITVTARDLTSGGEPVATTVDFL